SFAVVCMMASKAVLRYAVIPDGPDAPDFNATAAADAAAAAGLPADAQYTPEQVPYYISEQQKTNILFIPDPCELN
ncbi:Protein of unknown function, partial [Gryllus bimaculatus]